MTLKGGPGPREYVIAVQSASRLVSGNWPMSLEGAPASAQADATPARRAGSLEAAERPGGLPTSQDLSGADLSSLHQISELALRSSARRELLRSGAQPVRDVAGRGGSDAAVRFRTARRSLVPAVGERRDFLFSVQSDLTVSCEDTAAVINASAKAVGEHFAIYRDLQENSGFTAADYVEMLAALEDVVYPVNTSYFGEPADIDGNERIIVLVTEETNKLSGPSGLTFIAGFFVPSDLSDSGDPEGGGTSAGGVCATSNEAEILYLIAPDPSGTYGIPHTVEFAKETVISDRRRAAAHLRLGRLRRPGGYLGRRGSLTCGGGAQRAGGSRTRAPLQSLLRRGRRRPGCLQPLPPVQLLPSRPDERLRGLDEEPRGYSDHRLGRSQRLLGSALPRLRMDLHALAR
jgi:hypothetical protein